MGHPIIHSGDRVILIDTGTPFTINSSNKLMFCSENHDCSTNYLGLTTAKLSQMLGRTITTLLGADIISKYSLLLDYKNSMAQFDTQDISCVGNSPQTITALAMRQIFTL